MTNHDLEDEIDQLAEKMAEQIQETEEFLDELPEFAPRSDRSKKLQQAVKKNNE